MGVSANSVAMAVAEKLLFSIIEGLCIPDDRLLPLAFDETLEKSVEKVCKDNELKSDDLRNLQIALVALGAITDVVNPVMGADKMGNSNAEMSFSPFITLLDELDTDSEHLASAHCFLEQAENECEDIEVPAQKLEYTLKCQNVTRTHCSNGLTTINADAPAEKEKRDAEPDANPQLLLHPVVPLLKHTCVDTVQEHCFQEPKITEVSNTVQRCLVKTTVECEDVDHTIPKTVCDHTVPVTYFG